MARMAQFEKARRCLDTALQAQPESALLHNVYGVVLMDQAEWAQVCRVHVRVLCSVSCQSGMV